MHRRPTRNGRVSPTTAVSPPQTTARLIRPGNVRRHGVVVRYNREMELGLSRVENIEGQVKGLARPVATPDSVASPVETMRNRSWGEL